MFLSATELRLVWGVAPRIIAHIGAHIGEEKSVYTKLGVSKTIWIEAQPDLAADLAETFRGDSSQEVVCAAVWSSNDIRMTFNLASNVESSSLLNMKLHSTIYPEIKSVEAFQTKTKTIDSIVKNLDEIDFMNIDIQGAELEALKGATRTLTTVKWIYIEVNEIELYENCPLISDIDNLLQSKGFERVVKRMWLNHGWGDSLYLRNDLIVRLNPKQLVLKAFFDFKWNLSTWLRLIFLSIVKRKV